MKSKTEQFEEAYLLWGPAFGKFVEFDADYQSRTHSRLAVLQHYRLDTTKPWYGVVFILAGRVYTSQIRKETQSEQQRFEFSRVVASTIHDCVMGYRTVDLNDTDPSSSISLLAEIRRHANDIGSRYDGVGIELIERIVRHVLSHLPSY